MGIWHSSETRVRRQARLSPSTLRENRVRFRGELPLQYETELNRAQSRTARPIRPIIYIGN